MEAVTDFIFLGSKVTVDGDCSHEVERRLLLGKKAMTNLDSVLKSRDITLPTKVRVVKLMVFFSSGEWMWELNHKSRLNNKEFMLLNYGAGKDSWESFELQGDQTSHSKENQPWIFIGRADAEALVLWPPDAKSQLIEKDPDAEKDWRQKRKGQQRVRWLNGISDPMDMSLSKLWDTVEDYCSSWNHKESDMT